MTWLNRNLTLDLLAIGIHAMQQAFDRINAEPDAPGIPVYAPQSDDAQHVEVGEVGVLVAEPAPSTTPEPDPVPAPQPGPDVAELRATAQQLLRGIANAGGNPWIAGTLFPHFGIDHLDKLPADKWEELITMAQQHTEEA